MHSFLRFVEAVMCAPFVFALLVGVRTVVAEFVNDVFKRK